MRNLLQPELFLEKGQIKTKHKITQPVLQRTVKKTPKQNKKDDTLHDKNI